MINSNELTHIPLPANGVYTQTYRDRLQGNSPILAVSGLVYADKAGTLVLEESEDGTTFTATETVAVGVKTTARLEWAPLSKRYYRFKYTNGAAANTVFTLIQRTSDNFDVIKNRRSTLFASAARTATINSGDQYNPTGRGLHVVIKVTAKADSPSVVPKIQGKDAGGNYYDLLEGAAITDVGTTILKVAPYIAAAANVAVADLVPEVWRLSMTHSNTDSITYEAYFATDY